MRRWMLVRVGVGALAICSTMVADAQAQSPDRDNVTQFESCRHLAQRVAYVEVDSARRLHVCARVTTATIGPYLATPVVRSIGDTVFISAVVELPKKEALHFTEVSWVAYQVFLGPFPRGTRLRVTTRPFSSVLPNHRGLIRP